MTLPLIARQAGFMERIRSVPAAHRFQVEIEGIVVGEFMECGGLSVERKVFELPEGGVNDFVHRKPGQVAFANITLKRGLTYDRDLLDWCLKGRYDGRIERRNLSVLVTESDGRELFRVDFYDAYPVNWALDELRSEPGEVAWESLELIHAQSSGGGGGGGHGHGAVSGRRLHEPIAQGIDARALADRLLALMRREAAIERERERGV